MLEVAVAQHVAAARRKRVEMRVVEEGAAAAVVNTSRSDHD